MARVEPSGTILRRLYDLPVFTVTGTLSLTSGVTDYSDSLSHLLFINNLAFRLILTGIQR
ncbi:hypothetical protein CH49_2512 [Yersinia enterocolitica]|nr:hypothetical protein CH49_2512 [Yersinia enterocolitica]